ncbi:MAG TPA: ubiquinone/menaquinone biosynthesis methyltransferase [Terriglobales bacterium]|nr:ubiquinone/menaquinone biosynthesis methyltransferase [Terriglobales bacterium]
MTDRNKSMVIGAAPAGARDQASAARAVREMFSSIAPRYDLANHLLSFNIDRWWWWRAARTFTHILSRPEATVLDLCCGTGDMAFALRRRAGLSAAKILGADFAHPMLERAAAKSAGGGMRWVEADALNLPLEDASFDLVTSAFGFRNLTDYDAGLREIVRVLRPGGECGILECSEPEGLTGKLYGVYFRRVLPAVGTAISGVRGPYAYLPASVGRFPRPTEMTERMRGAGFGEASWTPYTFGTAGLYWGRK